MFARSVQDSLKAARRRILVVGAPGTGKTTFSVSASKYAGDTIPAPEPRLCKDVAVLQGDMEGVAGAWRAGFEPGYVYDLSCAETWSAYEADLVRALKELRTLTDVRYVVIDLSLPNRLINKQVAPAVQKDWQQVAKLGSDLFNAFSGLPGVCVIGNAQIKASAGIAESSQAVDASNAKAVGGERSTFASDLYKGVGLLWVENASLMITREIRRKKGDKAGEVVPVFSSHTQSNTRYEAKSRFRDVLLPTEPGEHTLHSLLQRAYGDAL